MDQNLETLYTTLCTNYRKDTDQDFPTNKIRFFMDFLWNAVVRRPLTEEQKTSLKGLIDLLNALDDNKLSPTRELIASMNAALTPLLATYPSLGHTFTFVVTTLIPAYQRYLTSLEGLVKNSHPFTTDEVLLYYDMTLVDHAVLSHVFESEATLNLIEVITSIKTIIVVNALTHDYLQDSLSRSISLFTFLQRGGLAKDKCHDYYLSLVDMLIEMMRANVTNEQMRSAVEHLCRKFAELSTTAATSHAAAGGDQGMVAPTTSEVDQLNSLFADASTPLPAEPQSTPVDATPDTPAS